MAKFETKITKLGIDENEVKNIIANCFCGEVNGAYLIDLTKEKKEFIMEVIGNYFNMQERDEHIEETEWTDIKRIATFCKTFGITEDEIPNYYRMGFNEGGCDIAYNLESNPNIILVLTDDERYHNSFISYAPSQTGELELLYEKPDYETEDYVKNCQITLYSKYAKYVHSYDDIKELNKDEIKFLTGKNTGENLITKLEFIKNAKSMKTDEKYPADSIMNIDCNDYNITSIINELQDIKKKNGKILVSKDFKYRIEVKVLE